MKTCSSGMKRLAFIILIINSFCVFSQIPHEFLVVAGCFENGTTESQFEFDSEEVLYVDFDREEVVYSMPRFVIDDPSTLFENLHVYKNARKHKKTCSAFVAICKAEEKNPPEEMDPPESILYPSNEVQFGVANILICFVNHFYPPGIKVSWTRNGHLVSEGVSLSRYYPNNDQTFHQFTTLTFTPKEGDIYSCTVEHLALDRPQTKIWEPDFRHRSLGPDVYCGVGLALGLLGVVAGTFLMVKGHRRQ
ncbi:H-2 class II histocompatibility antigen, A-U alpha chain-like [Anoplopoma fimbria]|uniref:H-2 class II histocompatibility antigen, A-U alpha chain-like n=1 Tax=Anoplopoma fimbria TaxID=229290 RepID=UPI0023EC4C03|nr:H-2 class II histocompatibility antigen, A-U alpha chain-like [Anoplopoma fimbria]XP_054478407.1 H-2 class II histocompatibility antigen, A-U alpha chain-like [Anoplopoma fimbria]XP_054478408.1 H-2 class II histocompatibility antigen, A-U alpha chain-like [Anoplopoma fimbria]XP_054478409.1 H-2 class II histocompatibility antigen, A-U alpha chain-like [Anoplopoma fimbria]XP_054478410.1 H-2 class II histocompatibility antigen, A-U alpha chain-like [Anoplopoma fimbria]XP_054478411.1 H-2 class 